MILMTIKRVIHNDISYIIKIKLRLIYTIELEMQTYPSFKKLFLYLTVYGLKIQFL